MRAAMLALLAAASPTVAAGCREQGERTEHAAEAERPYAFTTLEYPGAATTVASDVTDDGVVVGWYVQGDTTKGFVYRAGEYTAVAHPGAVLTQVTAIGADGSLVGAYRRAGEPPVAWHGFLRRPSGEFVEVRHPDHPYSMAQRILDDGTIVGCYHGGDYTESMRAMVVADGRHAVLDNPGSMYTGATPDGSRLVGFLTIGSRGFVAEGGRVTHLEAPGSASTEVWDVNAAGAIVGAMVDSTRRSRGFVLRDGRWTPVEVPQARSTVVFGINARGDLVGGWQDAEGKRRAYLASRQ